MNRLERLTASFRALVAISVASGLLACGGGGGSEASAVGTDATAGCAGNCGAAGVALTVEDVQRIIAQAVGEARARNTDATIAVVDRVGNVLAVYRRGMGPRNVTIATALDANGQAVITAGLEGIRAPIDDQAAIAKAVTGAYLSSEGNAFSTRTASQIVQEHFNPGEDNQPSGPLFGVQFSQLGCSDFSRRFNGGAADPGPKRSPLGLSADPGGLPLYKGGTVVGGVGVIADDVYEVDKVIADDDANVDELIAYAATFGFSSPLDRRGDRITVDGKAFRFSDVDFGDLAADPAGAPSFASIPPAEGAAVTVRGYTDGTILAGTAFGTPPSGIRPDGDLDYPGLDAFVFVDEADQPRFRPRAASDAGVLGPAALTQHEVRVLLQNALAVANRGRAQIRRPLGSSIRVTVSVVDTFGTILGMARTRDAPVFGADVSLQKARTAAFFSSSAAADFLRSVPDAQYALTTMASVPIGSYVDNVQAFVGDPDALEDGVIAFSDRAGGNLSRPFYPDGINENPHGPFSKPRGEWSPFSTGLQLDLANNAILRHVGFVAGLFPSDTPQNCAGVDLGTGTTVATQPRLANGLQIFPGSVPVFRGDVLVGGIGVSGDGVDQDDMVAFLGLHNAGLALGSGIGNAPPARRADTLTPQDVRLRYVQCPQAPFIDTDEQNVCDGK